MDVERKLLVMLSNLVHKAKMLAKFNFFQTSSSYNLTYGVIKFFQRKEFMLQTNFRTRARPGLIANAPSISCLTKNKRREKRHVKYMVAGLVQSNRYWPRGVPSSFDFKASYIVQLKL